MNDKVYTGVSSVDDLIAGLLTIRDSLGIADRLSDQLGEENDKIREANRSLAESNKRLAGELDTVRGDNKRISENLESLSACYEKLAQENDSLKGKIADVRNVSDMTDAAAIRWFNAYNNAKNEIVASEKRIAELEERLAKAVKDIRETVYTKLPHAWETHWATCAACALSTIVSSLCE